METPRRSQSFPVDEVQVACEILLGAFSGKNVQVLADTAAGRRLTKRFLAMRRALDKEAAAAAARRANTVWGRVPPRADRKRRAA